jgi:hypothetical protein
MIVIFSILGSAVFIGIYVVILIKKIKDVRKKNEK